MPPTPEAPISDTSNNEDQSGSIAMESSPIDLERGVAVAAIDDDKPTQTTKKKNGGKHLRWTRITKSVEIKDVNTGLLRGSIAATNHNSDVEEVMPSSSSTQLEETTSSSTNKPTSSAMKTILNGVSGSASPGQVLALMGPSGSGK